MRRFGSRLLVFLLSTTFVFGQTSASSNEPPAKLQVAELTSQDYAVVSVVLTDALIGNNPARFKQLVLLDRTSIRIPPGAAGLTRMGDAETKAIQSEAKDLLDALVAANKDTASVQISGLQFPVPITLVNDDALSTFFGEKGSYWEGFYKSYPDSQGVTLVSRPVYRSDGKTALAYVGTMSGMLAGEGYLVLLEKSGDTWKVKHRGMTWVS